MILSDNGMPEIEINQGERLYLFIDGGQIPEIAKTLYQISGELELEPVYMLPPFDSIKEVSPYIIRVTSDVKRWFLSQQQVTAGFFFSSSYSLDNICDYYRQFIQVLSPYDSHVLLKMAHSEVAWLMLEQSHNLFGLPMNQAWLPTRCGWKNIVPPDGISEALPVMTSMYKISDSLWAKLGDIHWRNYVELIDTHLKKYFPELIESKKDGDLWIEEQARQAYSKGFTSGRDMLQYFNVIGCIGEIALNAKTYPEIDALIHTPSSTTPSQRIKQAAQLAYQHYQAHNQAQEIV